MTNEAPSSSPAVQSTPKFAVLEYPGISQPTVAATTAKPSSSSSGAQGRRAVAGSGPKITGAGTSKIGGDSFVTKTKNPEWLKDRTSVYDQVKARREEELAKKTPITISVTLPDGKVLEADKEGTPYQAWVTTPFAVAATISQGLADAASVARVTYSSFVPDYSLSEDGMEGEDMLSEAMEDGGVEGDNTAATNMTFLWDMMRPFVGSVEKLEFLKFEQDAEAKTVFWHSSAHMMGEALEHLFGSKLTIGPPLAGGFYYDSYMGSESLTMDDCTFVLLLCMNHTNNIMFAT